jgi:hypothetical protein
MSLENMTPNVDEKILLLERKKFDVDYHHDNTSAPINYTRSKPGASNRTTDSNGIITETNYSIRDGPTTVYDPKSRFGYSTTITDPLDIKYFKNHNEGHKIPLTIRQIPQKILIMLGLEKDQGPLRGGGGTHDYDLTTELASYRSGAVLVQYGYIYEPISVYGYNYNYPNKPIIDYFKIDSQSGDGSPIKLSDIPYDIQKSLINSQKNVLGGREIPTLLTPEPTKFVPKSINAGTSIIVSEESKQNIIKIDNSKYIISGAIIAIVILFVLLFLRRK